jgi:hypothetical protein
VSREAGTAPGRGLRSRVVAAAPDVARPVRARGFQRRTPAGCVAAPRPSSRRCRAAASDGASIAGTITVAPNLQSRAAGGVLFVIARSAADHRILAVRREDNVTFPFKFRISGEDAMIAGTAFAGPLDVTARLSKSGDAAAAKGDIEGTARGLRIGATDAKVTLDTVHE